MENILGCKRVIEALEPLTMDMLGVSAYLERKIIEEMDRESDINYILWVN